MNINEIAKLAGVSKATVSRVLNQSGYVSQKTKQQVETVIAEHNYTPSPSAVLAKKVSKTIGVIIPEISNSFFGEIIDSISRKAQEFGFCVVYYNSANSMDLEENAIQLLEKQRIAGLIITPATGFLKAESQRQLMSMYERLNIPIVVLDREFENSKWDGVFFENFQSTYLATTKLIEMGHRDIAIITGDLNLKIARQRLEGYETALTVHGFPLKSSYILEGDFTAQTAYQLTIKAFQEGSTATAYIPCNNRTGLGFIKACNQYGHVLGETISAIGIDHIPTLTDIGYPYSCVTRDANQMGIVAMDMILHQIKTKEKTKRVTLIPCDLQLRGSEQHALLSPIL